MVPLVALGYSFSAYCQDERPKAFVPKSIPALQYHQWAQTPPMGWNSWDCFGAAVNEAQTKQNADYMADKLAAHGWQYIVVDIQWYEPKAKGFSYRKNAPLEIDKYGRLLPAANRFPSAADGAGFKPLADYVHSKGLKFGIHLLRGIPRQAVEANTSILGTNYHAADVADKNHLCPWNPDMWGIDMSKPGAQEYYNSVFDLIASWEVDFVKVDDLSRPYDEHKPEIEAIRQAIDLAGQPIVLSTSPGETLLSEADHVATHTNMWRISDDFWDTWAALLEQFERLKHWAPLARAGAWPDADMLPFGVLEMGKRNTRFSRDEQRTVMTLWCIARSPLIMGGDLRKLDGATASLLTNDEVLAVNRKGESAHELFHDPRVAAWVARLDGERCVALFNLGEAAAPVSIPVSGHARVRDLWERRDLGIHRDIFAPVLPPHGAGLYRLTSTS
jgi:hypothetical protein